MKIDLVKFYRNEIKNNRGVTLEGIWGYNNTQLEKNHHFIQWLFPTDQISVFNWSAPVLYQPEIISLRQDDVVMKNFRKSLTFFFKFYGLILHDDDSMTRTNDFENRATNWITPSNHNYKRISRILRFLTIFGFDSIKCQFVKMLNDIYKEYGTIIGEKTYSIWMSM